MYFSYFPTPRIYLILTSETIRHFLTTHIGFGLKISMCIVLDKEHEGSTPLLANIGKSIYLQHRGWKDYVRDGRCS
jgi:hypothetical protein